MMIRTTSLLAIGSLGLLLSLLTACGESRPVTTGCETQEVMCFSVDREGCCSGSSLTANACDGCPSGFTEGSSCRTEGCIDCPAPGFREAPAAIAPPPTACREDLGSGCCGGMTPSTTNTCGGVCPMGSIAENECSGFGTACVCGSTGDEAPAMDAGGAPLDGGAARPAPVDGGAVPPLGCHADFGGGCCGATVERDMCGVCPAGSVEELSCEMWAGDSDPGFAPPRPADAGVPSDGGAASDAGPVPNCFADMGDGCCGAPTGTQNACGACFEGIPESMCTSFGPCA